MVSERGQRSAVARRRPQRAVAITGACSFLGRHLVELLEADPATTKIVVLDLQSPDTAKSKTRFYDVDLTKPAASERVSEILGAENVDALVHLAFLGRPTTTTAWAHELESVGTMHVMNAARARGVGKVVLASTTLVYGAHPDHPNYLTERHQARGMPNTAFLADKLEAEREVRRFAQASGGKAIVLRFAQLCGPTVKSHLTRWLSRRFVPVALGHDPLVQLLHEQDAVAALAVALDRDASGTFNIVGDGVLPLSTVIKLAGRTALPLPWPVLTRSSALLWTAGLTDAPPGFLRFLRYLCVADGERAAAELGFRPGYTTREAVLDFGGALRLREARLLRDS